MALLMLALFTLAQYRGWSVFGDRSASSSRGLVGGVRASHK